MSESARRIAELQRELAGHPGSRQFYQLGELLRREGRSAEAAEALRAGLAHHPRYVAAWVALGRACLETGQAPEAIQGLEQALALDRQNPVAWRLLGEACLATGDRLSALDAWKQCLELVPGDDVLQAAVDGLTADVAAAHAAEPPPAAEEAPARPEEPQPEPVAPEAEATPAAPPAAEAPAVEAAPGPLPVTPVDTMKVVIEPFGPEPHLEPVAPAAEPGAEAFPEPPPEELTPAVAPPPAEEAPLRLSAAPPAPAEATDREEEIFTAPETEEAPRVLKAVLQAPAEPAGPGAPAHPPATLALARLYVQQQALPDATLVLQHLLGREPGNVEARDLLALVQDMMEPMPAAPPPLSNRERTIAALQHWLACLTLGQERATR